MKKRTTYNQNWFEMGERVKKCRKHFGLSREQLVQKIEALPENCGKDRSVKQIEYIENGIRRLSDNYAMLISRALGVRVEYLKLEDDAMTEMEFKLFPAVKSILHRKDRERAVFAFLNAFGLAIECNVKCESTTNDFVKLEEAEMECELERVFREMDGEKAFALVTSSGKVLKYISERERDFFIDELSDFAEFKLNKLLEGR